MKKNYFNLLTVALLCMAMAFSCSKENTSSAKEDNALQSNEYLTLNADLDTYIHSFSENNEIISTRGGFWKNLWKIVKGDALGVLGGLGGGLKGAIIGGIVGSGKAAIEIILPEKPKEGKKAESNTPRNNAFYGYDKDGRELYYLEPQMSEEVISPSKMEERIGLIHNFYMDKIKIELDSLFIERNTASTRSAQVNDMSETRAITRIVSDKLEAIDIKISDTEKEKISENIEQINNFICSNKESELVAFFEKEGLKEEYEVINKYIENMDRSINNQELLMKYTSGYLNIIKESSIPKESADIIFNSIMVAINSSLYWDNFTKQ